MNLNEDGRLPTSVGGLIAVAARSYLRRGLLYFGLAILAFVVQFVLDVLLPHSDGSIVALGVIVDAFLAATISIGVVVDLTEKTVDFGSILSAAILRWGAVTVVGFIALLATIVLERGVYGSLAETGYGLFVIPIVALWGVLALASALAAIEPVTSRLLLPFLALGKASTVGFSAPNLGRLIFLSLILALPGFGETFAFDWLTHHQPANAAFWANVPIDALFVGPFQALVTVFLLNFFHRVARR